MNLNIDALCQQLVKAVSLILDPNTPNNQRIESHKLLDEFRDTSPFCAECGFFLADQRNSCEVRHFGLQLIEHYIKLHWNEISCDEKLNIKEKVLEVLSKNLTPADNNHVKLAVAKIIVEIIIREWPQQWPTLLTELHHLCIMGTMTLDPGRPRMGFLLENKIPKSNPLLDVQTEVVLLIFLRLAEDVVQIQNVPDKRRREVFKALCLHMKDLFPFFLNTLSVHCEKLYNHKNSLVSPDSAYHYRTIHVTLETLNVYLEWVSINLIKESPLLMTQLCHLLDDEVLQASAAKCLLSLVERKGKPEDRIPILDLFEHAELFKIHSCSNQSLEQFNVFEKYFCRMLVTLGTTLSQLKAIFKEIKEPNSFPLYLNCILTYTRHPNMVISQSTQSLWMTLLRDQNFSLSPSMSAVIPILLKYETERIFIIGYPSKSNSKASSYSLLEFDSDEDFTTAFCKFRSEVMDVIKIISKLHPDLAFSEASTALKALLSGQTCPFLLGTEDIHCLDNYMVWDAFIHYIDSVTTPLMKNMNSPNVQKLSLEGVNLLQLTITFKCEDPNIMSYVLSCTSALFFFANFSSNLLVPLLTKIFSNLTNQSACDEKKDESLPKDVLNLRRHSCSLLIKLATTQPKLLMVEFDHICHCISQLMEKPELLSALEKSSILETLMILSNELNDYDRQLKLLNDMLSPVFTAWLSDDMKSILSSPDHFITFVGLNKAPDESDSTSNNRAQILYFINVIKTCAKRCRIITDPDITIEGKFIHPLSKKFNCVLYKNPSSELLLPAFAGVFFLMRTMNALHHPDVQKKLHRDFIGVTGISEAEKNSILAVSSNNENIVQSRSSFERMRNYLQSIYDACLHTLGDSTENLSIDFYLIPDLSNYFIECVFYCFQHLPDIKLRNFITFLKPFFYRCPVDLCTDFVDILAGFCNFMYEKLSSSWQKFKQRYGTSTEYENQVTETEEILADQLNRLLSREYINFLGALLQSKPMVDSSDTQMEDDSKNQQFSNSSQSKLLSELGVKIFQSEAVRGAIVSSVFDGLHWLDTVTNIHCLNLCNLVFKQLLKDNLILQVHEANYLLQNSLYGLQEHGEHESNQGLLLSFCTHVYEKLRPMYPELREFLLSSVSCDVQALNKMESILFKYKDESPRPSSEKQKKEAFRNVVKNIIGKNIGQYHKRDIKIKNLPPLLFIKKEKKTDILSDLNEESGLCKLFCPEY